MSSNAAAGGDSFVEGSAAEKTFDWPEQAHPSITLNLEVPGSNGHGHIEMW